MVTVTFATKKLSTAQLDKRRKPNSPFVRAVLTGLVGGMGGPGVGGAVAVAGDGGLGGKIRDRF